MTGKPQLMPQTSTQPHEELAKQHGGSLLHHFQQGKFWLSSSACGEYTAAVSYAALEFRFALERLVLHFWRLLLDRPFDENDMLSPKFDSVRRRVRNLAGRQHQIERHFEFARIVANALKLDVPLPTPDLDKMYVAWGDCSGLCHIEFPLSCAVPDARADAFAKLVRIEAELRPLVHSGAWPLLREASLDELRKRFADDKADASDILEHLRRVGAWAKVEYPDGRVAFAGEAIPPAPRASEDRTS